MTSKNIRLRELDFLRGIAIILVLLRHKPIFAITTNLGWTGVDLFFVLSGFLVSGLLFKEYKKFGNIKPMHFLIRRGFKIYPIYYLFYLVYLLPVFSRETVRHHYILSDLFFVQNYITGLGYAYSASWSLAVEEHFYFGLAILIWFVLKKKIVKLDTTNQKKITSFEIMILGIMLFAMISRLYTNLFLPNLASKYSTMTHLRIDSLLAGVLVSYWFYFRGDFLRNLFEKYKLILFLIFLIGISWPAFNISQPAFLVSTLGLTILYIAFSILLIYFLIKKNINLMLDKIFSKPVVNIVSKIGYCSYSIYVIHIFIMWSVKRIQINSNLYYNQYLYFAIDFILCVVAGMIMTYGIEKHFLRIRDKFYPSRVI